MLLVVANKVRGKLFHRKKWLNILVNHTRSIFEVSCQKFKLFKHAYHTRMNALTGQLKEKYDVAKRAIFSFYFMPHFC